MLFRSVVKAICRRTDVSLMPPFAAKLGIILSVGNGGKRYCAVFGGETKRNVTGRFKGKDAPPPGACPPCGNAVVDTAFGETCDDGNTASGDGCSATCRAEIPRSVFVSPSGSDTDPGTAAARGTWRLGKAGRGEHEAFWWL